MNLSRFTDFFRKNKKAIFILITAFLVLSPDFAFAEGEDKIKSWTDAVHGIMAWLSVLVWVITYFITLFLEPGWINWSIFWLDIKFKAIWILVSNVVYFIFAFILIWIAFMNILGRWDKWELKQALPKFVVWVLIVPFSWFFVQFILSVSAILTVSSLTLPFDTFSDFQAEMNNVKIPKTCNIDITSKKEEDNWKWFFNCTNNDTVWLWESLWNTAFWVISVYSYWILKLDKIDEISQKQITEWKIETVWDLLLHIVFNVLFILVYMILLISLWIVLAVRGVYLWIYTMISPVFWLMYFFDKKEGWWDWFFSKFNIKEFISLALVPVYVVIALSFWLLFIYVILKWIDAQSTWNLVWSSTFKIDSVWITIKWLTSEDDFRLNVEGAIWTNTADWISDAGWFLYNIWDSVLWIVWTLILQIFWIVVLRIAIMSALRTSDITKAVVEPIYQFGNQVWQLAAKAPTYAPVFGGKSATELSSAGSALQSSVHSHFTWKWSEWWQSLSPFWTTSATSLKTVNMQHEKDGDNKWAVSDHIRDMSKSIKDLDAVLKKPSEKSEFMEMIKMKFWKELYDEVKDATTKEQFYNKFKSNNQKITTIWWRNYYDQNLQWKNNAEVFADVFESVSLDSANSSISKVEVWLDTSWVNPVIIIWNSKKQVTTNSEGKVTGLWNIADELAQHIIDNNYNSTSIEDLKSSLELTDDALSELNKYFKEKDWKVTFIRNQNNEWLKENWYSESNLDNYLKQNDPKLK